MLKKHLFQWFCFLFLLGGFSAAAQSETSAAAASGDSVLLMVQGRVEVSRAGTTTWTAGEVNQVLKPGDRVRTGKNSRATVRLSNLSVLRVHELSTLEIQAAEQAGNNPTLNLKSGSVYFFNRDKPQTTQFQTPTASGAIRGTEFNLAVAEDGRMLLTLIDGEVDLQNELGTLELRTGEQALVEPGQAPRKTPALDAINVIQWTLYYPAVLDPNELGLSAELQKELAPSLDAYRAGDIVRAMELYPFDRESASPEDKVYRAALLLSVGNVEQAQSLLQNLGEGRAVTLAGALRQVIAAVKNEPADRENDHVLASEWMAGSYYAQSQADLELALEMARAAARVSPEFGYAHARVAELEFSFGRTDAALTALDRGLAISPRNAYAHSVRGFLLTAKNKMDAAAQAFDEAIALDGSLGNAWLGRGLVKIKRGNVEEGRKDLQTAAAQEPNRAIFRSYLGKAWSMGRPFSYSWDQQLADKELDLAKRLDPNDPTAYLYSALLNQQRNQINAAVEDLEKSQDLNDNRHLFRSKLLLDQDRAVRSANLASIYRDAGMTEYSVREASKAVNNDPANYSAHMFLAQSYDSLRDPQRINLRYDTPWLSELLLANLLQPVGAGNLSQTISQQEYSRLFEANRVGLFSRTHYESNGDWLQQASQFGTLGNSSYALDFEYRSRNGQRPNNDLELKYYSAKFKQQVTEKDSVFFQITRQEQESGDLLQYYNQASGSTTLRTEELQEPNLYLGYHREWSPGNHTLLMLSRLDNSFELQDSGALIFTAERPPGSPILGFPLRQFSANYESEFVAYSAELQQIMQISKHTIIAGARVQMGESENSTVLFRNPLRAFPPVYNNGNPFGPVLPAAAQNIDGDLYRYSAYAYDNWQILEPLTLIAGLTYDYLHFPENTELPPLSSAHEHKDQLSPKIGLRYDPLDNTTLRAAYTRSLGGMLLDQNVRLEPSQVAGFTQAYRSLVPESVIGAVPGTRFTTFGLGVDQRIPATRTYLTLNAEQLESESERTVGVFEFQGLPGNAFPSGVQERLRYRERSVSLAVNQLLGDEWAIGGSYRITDSDLNDLWRGIPAGPPSRNISSTLQQANVFLLYHHRCGFFARNEATWASQENDDYAPVAPGDDFWQFHSFIGYRFPRRQAEIQIGILNIFDQDYQLAPLNYYIEYPRERTFVASLKFEF